MQNPQGGLESVEGVTPRNKSAMLFSLLNYFVTHRKFTPVHLKYLEANNA